VDLFDLGGVARAVIAAALAVVPAIVAYVRGRQIARFADDPALPERLFAGRRVSARALVFTIALVAVLAGKAALWAIPLAVIAYFAAGLPLRRLLYNETWSLGFYLSLVIRFIAAFWTLWVLVAALPALALWAGDRAWIVVVPTGIALTMAAGRQTEIARRLLGARQIADATVRARFERLAAAAGLTAPRFEVVDLKGGGVANAFALPSLAGSAVVFSGPLLERLDADEVDAICAHELAHIEHHNPRRLRQRRLVCRALIGGAALLVLLQTLVPSIAWVTATAWPAAVVVVLAAMARDRQKHETASDLRAVALTGNPEALVRALVKIHAIARVPRRWDVDLERHLSHPSLKRRIQDIRAAAGTPPAALGETAVFDSADGAARAVFADDSLEWSDGAGASFRLRYDRLRELRVAATRTGETTLVAADRSGHRWQMPLRVAEVPRLQAVLDIVDARVGTGGAPASAVQPLVVRVGTLMVCILSLNMGMLASAMVVALALAQPAAPLVGAAGLAAIAGALLAWRDGGALYGLMPGDVESGFAAVLLAGGALLVWLAYARRRDEVPARAWRLVGVIAAAAILSWLAPIATGGVNAIDLQQAAHAWPATVVFPLALAGALLWSPRKPLRLVAAAGAVAGVSAAAIGSQAFLDRFGHDPFLVPAARVAVRTLDRPVAEFTLPFAIGGIELSPGGRSLAVVSRRADYRAELRIGRVGGELVKIDGDGALFVDDDRAIVWTAEGDRSGLRQLTVTAPAVGQVEALDLRPGDILAPNATAVTLVEDDQLFVRIYVPETMLGHVSVGQKVAITVDSFPRESFPGVVQSFSHTGEYSPRNLQTADERADQVFATRVGILGGADRLRAGMAASIRVPRGS